jgi:hypothetical protein
LSTSVADRFQLIVRDSEREIERVIEREGDCGEGDEVLPAAQEGLLNSLQQTEFEEDSALFDATALTVIAGSTGNGSGGHKWGWQRY